MSTLVASFARLLHANPHRRLIHLPAFNNTSFTSQKIWDEHLAQTAALRACGLRPGQLLMLAVGNKPAGVSLLLAARQVGLAVLSVDPGTTGPELHELAERFRAAAIVLPVEHGASLGRLVGTLSNDLVLLARAPHIQRDGEYADVALLKLTSGSTGLPKAARTTESQLIVDTEHITEAMAIGADDTQIAVIPLSHAYGFSVVLMPLLLQGTPIVLRESFVPHQLPTDATTHNARTFPGVPFMFEYFLAHPPAGGWPASLDKLVSAGARLPPETVRTFFDRFGLKIHSFYGTTESGGIAFDSSDSADVADTVGWPLPGVTITLSPDDDAPEGSGRVHIRGGGVANGYEGGTDEEFRDDGFLSGDYGMFDSEGRLCLTGRASAFINVAGKKVQPAEVEEVLRQMPGVREVRVLSAADAQRGEQVAACIVTDRAHTLSTLAVRRFCSARLAAFKIPRVIVFLDAIPLTARGKVDRRALEEAIKGTIASFPEQLC